MFWCVVGLYPDNLQEAWASGRERRINITDSSFIRRPIPAGARGSHLPVQESVELGLCSVRMDAGLKPARTCLS